jgi:hypothetical protein
LPILADHCNRQFNQQETGEIVETIKESESLIPRSIFLNHNAVLVYLALAKLFIHLATNLTGGYGYFRDELYYIACSDHMAWGYVDQPPFSIAALWMSRLLFGDSLFALRLFPAIAGATVVILAGLMSRELGGKRFAQVLASCSVIVAPLTLGTNSIFSMNSFDVFFWTLAFYLIILIIKKDEQKHWLLLGLILGLGLLNKISVLWLGTGLAAGLLLTPSRKLFLTRRVWIAAAIALLLFLPHVLWQVVYGFPTLEFIKNATAHKYVAVSPLDMFLQQALNMNPLTLPLWISGLFYFLVSKSARQFRILPFIYFTVFLILVINKNSKAEYLGPMFPMLFAAGAFTIEKFILRFNGRWIKPAILIPVIFSGIVFTPFALAVLPVETFITYTHLLGMTPSTSEKKELNKLPQFYADMFGWENIAAVVADAYNTLTPDEKTKCAILCNNYGEAGAIDFFGRKYGLPKASSGHNNYWLWGCRNAAGEVVIRLGGSREPLLKSYREVKQTGVCKDAYCMPYENNMPVYVCKDRRTPLKDDWTMFRHYE